jgi:hypothetical protein
LNENIANNVEIFVIGSSRSFISEWIIYVMELGDDEVGKRSVNKAGVVEGL